MPASHSTTRREAARRRASSARAEASGDTQPKGAERESTIASFWTRCEAHLLQPVDNASLTVYRVALGTVMLFWSWDYLASGRLKRLYLEPQFHFTYPYFDWVRPPGDLAMCLLFVAMGLAAFLIAIGFWYRAASAAFACCFTYFFLLEQTNYQNHYYLIALLSWSNVLLPLNRNLSWDARRLPPQQRPWSPRWALWWVRFHIGMPYFYGGLAKLTPDWLLGQPMAMMLESKSQTAWIGPWLAHPWAGLAFSWGGLLLDLLVVPALMWRRTRVAAYLTVVAFHLTNSVLFEIHIFPWLMILATTVFFEPDWPRRWLRKPSPEPLPPGGSLPRPRNFSLLAAAACLYLAFQLVWPLRVVLQSENPNWTERGQFFSWRMMLRGKTGGIRYFVTDRTLKATFTPDIRVLLAEEQLGKFPRNPDRVWQLARFLADRYENSTGRRPEVRALVLLSLNGRKPQLLVDPNADLASVDRHADGRPWVLPNQEPLPAEPWDVPLDQWSQQASIPPLRFLETAPLGEAPPEESWLIAPHTDAAPR